MKQIKTLVMTTVVVASALMGAAVFAQQPQHPGSGDKPPAGGQMSSMPMGQAPMGGGMGPGMMACPMMGGGMMSGGIMPMMMGGDAKQQAEMLSMRAEMMKAMADIMLKYAQRAQSGK